MGCQIPELGQCIQLGLFDVHPCWENLPVQAQSSREEGEALVAAVADVSFHLSTCRGGLVLPVRGTTLSPSLWVRRCKPRAVWPVVAWHWDHCRGGS